jgi:hypothetical protein
MTGYSLALAACGTRPARGRLHLPERLPPIRTVPWESAELPGPYRAPRWGERPARSFRRSDRILATYYFYWYDAPSGLHTQGACGALTLHPPSLDGFSTFDPAWHAKQLTDMVEAGVDVVLPVYWGDTGNLDWSQGGLERLVVALQAIDRAGLPHPQVGMFLDTSSLQAAHGGRPVDIAQDPGRTMFTNFVRAFYSLVPPRYRALVDGRPLLWLYSAAFVARYDEAAMRAVAEAVARDFGAPPYVVREASWCLPSDDVYAWGAASDGPNMLGVLAVGPGFDNTAVAERCEPPLVVPRRDGDFYRTSWSQVLVPRFASRTFAAVETWNELHEGTAICETAEYGRTYISLTRKYADLFHARASVEAPPGPYAAVQAVSVAFGAGPGGDRPQEQGLILLTAPDGPWQAARVDGQWAAVAAPNPHNSGYLYFRADRSFAAYVDGTFAVDVDYLDRGHGAFGVEYDSTLGVPPLCGAYAQAVPASVALQGSGSWRVATFRLVHARFGGLENAGADFRLRLPGPGFAVRRVVLRRA